MFLALLGLRVFHMTADPPSDLSWSGGLFFDEGALAQNARNQVLFGQWKLDEWNDFYYSPILSYMKWIIFAIFGVGMWQLRFVSLLFTTGTLAALYLSIKISQNKLAAALGMLLLGGNYLYLMYSRLGLTEISLLFWTVLTLYFWLLGFYAKTGWRQGFWMFWAGASCFVVYIFKALLIYFLPVPVAALIVFWLFPQNSSDRKRILVMIGWLLLGMAVTAALWFVLFYFPNYEPIHQAGNFVKMLSLPRSSKQFAQSVVRSPFFTIFLRTPVHLTLTIAYFIYLLYGLLHDRSKLSPLDVFAGLWFLAHTAFFVGYSYRPTRYYVPVIPAMSILTTRAIAGLFNVSRGMEGLKRVSIWFWIGCWLIGSVLTGYVILPLCYRYGVVRFLTGPRLQTTTHMVVAAGLTLIGVVVVAWWTSRYRPGLRVQRIAPIFQGMAMLLVLIFLGSNGAQYYRWASAPQYVVRDTSRELGRMLNNAFLAGLPTPMLCMENTHRALYVWENFTNYQDTFQKYPVTHLFLGEFNGEVDYYTRKFPDIMQRAKLLKTYWIMGSRFYLYSIVEPSLAHIQASQECYEGHEPVQVTFELTNNDPRGAKTFEPGILLTPANTALPIISERKHVRLEPLARTQLSFSINVSPGRYDLLAALFPEQQDIYEAETLHSQGNEIVSESEASGGHARYAPSGFSGFLVYGPYRQYPAGMYRVEFIMKLQGISGLTNTPLVTLDVSTDTGSTIIHEKSVTIEDTPQSSEYRAYYLSFALKQPAVLESRLFTHGLADVWVDAVHVSFVPGQWSAATIVVQDPS